MLGSRSTVQNTASMGGSSVSAPPSRQDAGDSNGQTELHAMIVLAVILGGLWVLWAVLTHKVGKIRDAVKPANVAANVYNAAFILLTVILGVPLLKLGLIKAANSKVAVVRMIVKPLATVVAMV